jgi:uncharacterized protein YuzE
MMRIDYDPDHDTVYIRLRETPRTVHSDEIEPGVIVDYGPEDQVLGFELLDAQRRAPWAAWMQWVDRLQAKAARA